MLNLHTKYHEAEKKKMLCGPSSLVTACTEYINADANADKEENRNSIEEK